MKKQSIELTSINEDPVLPKIVRHSFRVPILDKDKIHVTIQENSFPVLDLSESGISIAPQKKVHLLVDEKIKNCELHIFDTVLKGLTAQVVHFSSNSGEAWQYGLKWINLSKKMRNQLSEVILAIKEKLLKEYSAESDNS